ncbi:DUF3943 domain-containing protein [Flavobacterium franklandianum]|uniref:DUF3943 domain-containing protein n=1 Tax=Flavobacterium franklandianum TaxID=2594430 RepID=A0A553C5X6_9FLAO|nr:DUF3943 domain-containing protein [Flavobacterium franklandianum]TRX15940.1 DUF3943 domain-containing protein [Flavobacterium franklandianum]TRX27739.1 DUF3943 domain-containing protein [Flavobacterium franklandianum]
MTLKKTFLNSLLFFIICTFSYAQQLDSSSLESSIRLNSLDSTTVSSEENQIVLLDSLATTIDSIVPVQKKDSIVYPPPTRDWRRLGYTSTMYAGTTIIAFGVLWAMPASVTNWDKEEMREQGILWKWNKNINAGPVWDKDNWVLNWITHPYSGGIYYMTARSSGFTVVESFGYSAIMSTFFWEYGIESFAEIPSIQDLIITPVVGSVVGEGFFYAKKSILKHDKKVLQSRFLGMTTLFLMDPFNTILDGFGYKEKVKTQMNIAPVGANQFTKAPIWGVQFSARF